MEDLAHTVLERLNCRSHRTWVRRWEHPLYLAPSHGDRLLESGIFQDQDLMEARLYAAGPLQNLNCKDGVGA